MSVMRGARGRSSLEGGAGPLESSVYGNGDEQADVLPPPSVAVALRFVV